MRERVRLFVVSALCCGVFVSGAWSAPVPAQKAPEAAPKKEGDGGFDKKAFDQAHNNALDLRSMPHVVKLGAAGQNADAYLFLLRCGPFFIKDDEGYLNENADRDAFAAAVLNITPEMIQRCSTLAKDTPGASVRGALFILLSGSGPHVPKKGKFPAGGFNEAFKNIDAAKLEKAVTLTTATGDFVLTMLLRLSAGYLDKEGRFDVSGFNSRLAALKPADFTGDRAKRTEKFHELMKKAIDEDKNGKAD